MDHPPAPSPEELAATARRLRRRVLQMIAAAGAGHTGGSLSCLDLLVALYHGGLLRHDPRQPGHPDRDRYVQSKGHAAEALYAVLADRGYFPDETLATLGHPGAALLGHPTRSVPGVEANTGALGHGLSLAAGMALSGKMDGAAFRVFVLLGDGELAEGSNWEAALFAAHQGLDRLTALVDLNGLQITGPTAEVCRLEPLADKWRAFGWTVREVDGHDFAGLLRVLSDPPVPGRPTVVLARTVKGRGVSFMENRTEWHHGVPNPAQLAQALAELADPPAGGNR